MPKMHLNKTAVQIGLFIVGVGCLYAGKQARAELLTSLGLFCFGLILLIIGVNLIIRKRLEFQLKKGDIGPHEVFTGLSAQLWGVYFSLMGLMVIAFAAAYGLFSGGSEKIWSAILGTHLGQGMVLFLIGLLISIEGVIRLIAGTAGHNVVLSEKAGNCLERFGGGISLLFGLTLVGIGMLLLVAPGLINQFIHKISLKF
jgi:hypothetical protein